MKAIRIVLAVLLTVAFVSSNAQSTPKRPNVILILADDLGYGDLGCFGSKDIQTPHLDKLAAGGMKLTQFYAATPFCTPTRASLMTGRYPYRFGIKNIFLDREEHLPKGEVLLPGVLKTAGYATAHIGKWHLGGLNVKHTQDRETYPFGPHQMGFDYSLTMLEDPALRGVINKQGRLYKDGANYYTRNDTLMKPSDKHLTEFETAETLKLMERFSKEGKPFFINFCPFNPHVPLEEVPEKYMKLYAGVQDRDERLYRAMVSQLDGSVGAIMAKLKVLGIDDNTLVIFTSDNGPANNGSTVGYKGRKRDLYEGGIRVPTIFWWKGRIQQGSESNAVGHSNDLLPTLAEAAGAPLPTSIKFDGVSLIPLLNGKSIADRGTLFWHTLFPTPKYYPNWPQPKPDADGAVRAGKWKLLIWEDAPVALYNMEKDPYEKMDLVLKEEKVVEGLLNEYRVWKKESEGRATFTRYLDGTNRVEPAPVH